MNRIKFFIKLFFEYSIDNAQLKAIPLNDPSNLAITDIFDSEKVFELVFKKPLKNNTILQILLVIKSGNKSITTDFIASQFIRVGDLKPNVKFSLFNSTSNTLLVEILIKEIQTISYTDDKSIILFSPKFSEIQRFKEESKIYLKSYMDVISKQSWLVPELAKTHLAIWPVSIPGKDINSSPEIISIPASILTRIKLKTPLNFDEDYFPYLTTKLALLHGLDFNFSQDESIIIDLISDLCTVIQLNVEYLSDVDNRGRSIEKIKFPEMDNFWGEDCEGVACSSYRVWRYLQRYPEKKTNNVLFNEIIKMSKRYTPVILTGSAANNEFFEMKSSDLLLESERLICHVFCAAFPKKEETGLPPILLESTNQAENVLRLSSMKQQRNEFASRIMEVKEIASLIRKYDGQTSAQKITKFYRYVIEWWDETGSYLIKDNNESAVGIDFHKLFNSTRSDFELIPLPKISESLIKQTKKLIFPFCPQGLSWKTQNIEFSRMKGGLSQLKKTVQYRFHNINDEEIKYIYDIVLKNICKGDLTKISLHKIIIDLTPPQKHFHQISITY